MASGAILPQHLQGKAFIVDGYQLKDRAAGGKNCQALCDITNLVPNRGSDACRPEWKIVDIDAGDINDEFALVEYVNDLYSFYEWAERRSQAFDYMPYQDDINMEMRSRLVDWLVEVHYRFALEPEILHLTINILDRFLCVVSITREGLQLVGLSALLLASKYVRTSAPLVSDLADLSDGAYDCGDVLRMEKTILEKLGWTLTVPTPYVFLLRFIKASGPDEQVESMAHFLCEMGLVHYESVMHLPSRLAASAVYVARLTLNKTPVWDRTLEAYTGYSESELRDCAKNLVLIHMMAAAFSKKEVVFMKYAMPERKGVALLPPAKSLFRR